MNTAVWLLIICANTTWGGCGHADYAKFPDAKSCYEALDHIRVENSGVIATGEIAKNNIFYCRPLKENER